MNAGLDGKQESAKFAEQAAAECTQRKDDAVTSKARALQAEQHSAGE